MDFFRFRYQDFIKYFKKTTIKKIKKILKETLK